VVTSVKPPKTSTWLY